VDRVVRRAALIGLFLVAAAAWAQAPDAASGASPAHAPATESITAASPAAADASAGATPPARSFDLRSLAHYDLYDILRGPAFLAAWVVFVLGLVFRVGQYIRLTVRADRAVGGGSGLALRLSGPGYAGRGSKAADRPLIAGGRPLPARVWAGLRLWARNTILGSNPVMAAASSVFHVLLFVAPLLLPAHNILFDLTFRVSLPTLAEPLIDVFTVIVMAAGLFFLLRRLVIPRVRALTTPRDWLVLALVMGPFVTAFLAYHQFLYYRVVLLAHMMVGELVIAAVPFTAIGHMPFILFARFFTVGEYAWKPGNRRWR
jgi:nitrate reductase gamma subunit